MTRFSLLLHILALLALPIATIATEPIIYGTGPGERFWTTGGELENGTVVTEPSAVRPILAQCGIRDSQPNWLCFVGSGCLEGQSKQHNNFTMLDGMLRQNFDQNSTFKAMIENCDLGMILKPTDKQGIIDYEFHSKRDAFHLPVAFNGEDGRFIDIALNAENLPALMCGPSCDIYESRRQFADKHFYWRGNITIRSVETRARLEFCSAGRMICYVGDGCLRGEMDRAHSSIVPLTKDFIRGLSETEKDAMKTCNVGVTLRTKKAQSGRYKMEYHTAFNNAELTLNLLEFRRFIRIEDNGTLSCTPFCEFLQNNRDDNKGEIFWFSGEFKFIKQKTGVLEEMERKRKAKELMGAANKEDSKKIANDSDPKEGISMATLILICLGSLVVFIVVVVVIGTVVHHRRAAKTKLRTAAITAAANPKKKSAEALSNLNKEVIDPFLPKDPTITTQTCNDFSDSVRSEKSGKES